MGNARYLVNQSIDTARASRQPPPKVAFGANNPAIKYNSIDTSRIIQGTNSRRKANIPLHSGRQGAGSVINQNSPTNNYYRDIMIRKQRNITGRNA